jgi:ribose-phosphate pyrophosphokinase
MNIIGEVEGRTCVIMDDMVDTANTLCEAARALKEQGAVKVLAYATHPILSGNAVERITNSDLDGLVVTNTIALNHASANCAKIRQLSAAPLLAETIKRISQEESVSSLFMD